MRSCKYADNCTVCKWKPCPHDNHRSFVSWARMQRALKMQALGFSASETARVIGISKRHVNRLLKKGHLN